MKERDRSIDFLRAFSIIGVIVIHILSFSLTNSTNRVAWNILQFVVGIFIFCSGYVHAHYKNKLTTISSMISWYKKRFVRILLPFYIYYSIHILLFFFFPTIFTHFGLQKNAGYIFGSIFLYGGINANWLPLLFLQLSLLTPLFFFLSSRKFLWLYLFAVIIVIIVGTVFPFAYFTYRGLMWIGWSLIFLLGLFANRIKTKLISLFIGSGIIFSILLLIWFISYHSLNFTDNKYPPNLYYVSYAFFGTILLFLFAPKIVKIIPQWIYEYISRKSYNIFFIHFVVLDILLGLQLRNNWLLLTFIICVTLLVSKIIDFVSNWGES